MRTLSTALVFLVGVVNALPIGGVLSGKRLEELYGVTLDDLNLVVLMRHRAVLLGLVGGLLLVSAFHPPLRAAAYVAGFASMLSFVALVWLTGGSNAEVRRVAWVDVVASAALLAALVLDHTVGIQ